MDNPNVRAIGAHSASSALEPLSIARREPGPADVDIEMLDFCAKHRIAPEIERIPAQKINEAYARLLKQDVRYRFVIDMATLV